MADGGFLSLIDGLEDEDEARLIAALSLAEAQGADGDWESWAHRGQLAPGGDWRTWVVMAGRGFGKTLAGSQWIVEMVQGSPSRLREGLGVGTGGEPGAALQGPPPDPLPPAGGGIRIALVAATIDEARRVMVEGKSGLLAVAGDLVSEWRPTRRLLRFGGGAEATLFSGASPEALRGPEHHIAWCDELAKWDKPGETWDMLQLGLRLGERPRALVTTTPRPGPVLRRIMASPGCEIRRGSTRANPHLPAAYKETVEALYAGTRLGRQELDGELLSDAPGALWTVELIERCRLAPLPLAGGVGGGLSSTGRDDEPGAGSEALCPPHEAPVSSPGRDRTAPHPLPQAGGGTFTRTIIGVDPPAGDGTCGIVACARDGEGRGHVLADHSVTARSPEGWAGAVAAAVEVHGAQLVVAEQNQGGKMVASVLHTADPRLTVRLVTATVGKTLRAEPVSMLFEAGRVVLHGRWPELEAELLGMIAGGDYEGPGVSPDRADAMVWALTELMLAKERAEVRVRGL